MVKKEELLLEQWKMASELHRHMDNLAWQRFNYFMATNGLLVTALGAMGRDAFDETCPAPVRVMTVAIAVIGLLISIVWGLIQRRGQHYQYYRGAQARQTEECLRIAGERVLTLYEKALNDQDLIAVPKCARLHTHDLVFRLALVFAGIWTLAIFFLVFFLFLDC